MVFVVCSNPIFNSCFLQLADLELWKLDFATADTPPPRDKLIENQTGLIDGNRDRLVSLKYAAVYLYDRQICF
jgi:hypothetical protein